MNGLSSPLAQRFKPYASGGPTGLLTLAFYISFLWPLTIGRVDAAYMAALTPLGIIVAVVQIISGIIELRDGHILEGTIPLAFSCFMALGAGETLLKLMGRMPMQSGPLDGHIMLIMGLMMTLLLVYVIRKPLMVFLFYLANAFFFTPAAIGFLFDLPWLEPIANGFMLLVAFTAFWCGTAQMLEISSGRPVLWMGRPVLQPAKGSSSSG